MKQLEYETIIKMLPTVAGIYTTRCDRIKVIFAQYALCKQTEICRKQDWQKLLFNI
jgi:hypothetical protein